MAGNGLFRTKSIEQSIADTEQSDTKLKRDLTAWDLVVFGVAVVVGAGIFTVAASTAGNVAGPSVSLAFVIAAITCGLAALCYAEFASTVPVAGSAYTFSYATFGEFFAWLIGWCLVLEFATAAAVIATAWSSYLGNVFSLLGMSSKTIVDIGGLHADWGAGLIVIVLVTLLALGTKLSSRVSQVITAIKVAVVLLVIIAGIGYIKASNYTPFIPDPVDTGTSDAGQGLQQSLFSLLAGGQTSVFGIYGLFAAASAVFFAFIGFDIVATTAEETRNPRKDLPRGILGSLALVTVLYVAVALVVTGMANYKQLATGADGARKTLATAFEINGVTWVAGIITIGALAGLTTVVMVLLLGLTRVTYAMSRDGLLPRSLARTGSRGTPVKITVIGGAIVFVVATFFPAARLEEVVNVGTLVAFAFVSAGVMILRRTRPELPRGFRVPLMPFVPILSVLACLWLMLNLKIETWIIFLIWTAVGLVLYFSYGRSHANLARKGSVEAGGQVAASGA